MKIAVSVIQLATSILMITLIMLQAKGVGLGRAFGGSGEFYKSRRGVEKIIFNLTVFSAFLFLVSSIVNIILL